MTAKIYTIVLLLMLSSFGTSYAQENKLSSVELSDLDLQKIQQPYWKAQKDKAINGQALTIKDESFKKGIGTISESRIYVSLNGTAERFKAQVGLQKPQTAIPKDQLKFNALGDGSKLFYIENKGRQTFVGIDKTADFTEKGSVKFIIKGDGKELWHSQILNASHPAVSVDLQIEGIQLLELIVEDGGDGISGDLANWAEANIFYHGTAPQLLDEDFISTQHLSSGLSSKNFKSAIAQLPQADDVYLNGVKQDWLVNDIHLESGVFRGENEKEIIISNGLISRTFRLSPNAATVDFKNLVNDETLIRGIRPEASLTINGKTYQVGGLDGQIEYAYLKTEWLDNMWSPAGSFQLTNFQITDIKPRIDWKNKRWSRLVKEDPKGKSVRFTYTHPDFPQLKVYIHYNIYDGIPMISKWFTIANSGKRDIILNNFKSEILAFVEAESSVEKQTGWETPNIHIESDFAFHSMSMANANKVVHWLVDDQYTSQVSYLLKTPCLLECQLPIGPEETIKPGQTFESFRIWELPFDSYDKQRKGLYTNRMYETIAPWTTENPLFLHLTTSKESKVKAAIDQCAATGYEMVILSFGSGLDMEKTSEKYLKKYKGYADYAHSKGIEIGGYSLLSSRWISEEVDVINPETGKRGGTIHGSAPCLNSQWGIDYFEKLYHFFEKTGFDLLEHDGSYPGQLCASTTHIGHKGLEDSQWKAWKRITDFYKWCNESGISLNVPDWYYLSGSTKNGIGYREVNWSLPRERQLVLGRQNLFDGTYDRIPSMSWTFVPLSEYHGGGTEATIEPLNEHLDVYVAHMMQNYGMGVQACYRGPRLYDTEETKQAVIEVVQWYKKYRDILNSSIIHLKRADGRNIDGFMHVNPHLKEKGLAMFFNPTDKDIQKKITLPLYYTGIETKAMIRKKEGAPQSYQLNRDYSVEMDIEVPANSYTWFVIE